MKVLVRDGIGVWLAARRLNKGGFVWADECGPVEMSLSAEQLDAPASPEFAASLMVQLGEKDRELKYRQTKIDHLTHEMAMLKRYQCGRRSEQLDYAPGVFTVETTCVANGRAPNFGRPGLALPRSTLGQWVGVRCACTTAGRCLA